MNQRGGGSLGELQLVADCVRLVIVHDMGIVKAARCQSRKGRRIAVHLVKKRLSCRGIEGRRGIGDRLQGGGQLAVVSGRVEADRLDTLKSVELTLEPDRRKPWARCGPDSAGRRS